MNEKYRPQNIDSNEKVGVNWYEPLTSELLDKYENDKDKDRLKDIYDVLMRKNLQRILFAHAKTYGFDPDDVKNDIYAIDPSKVSSDVRENLNELIAQTESEVTEQAEFQLRLEKGRNEDELTGLLRRDAFSLRYEEAIKKLPQNPERDAVLVFVDLDYFKRINDTYGHNVADELLEKLGSKINQTIRQHDTAGRFGGDELTLLLTNIKKGEEAKAVERIYKELSKLAIAKDGEGNFFALDSSSEELVEGSNIEQKLSMSMGVRTLKGGEQEYSMLGNILNQADEAVYTTKKKGGRGGITYIKSLPEENMERSLIGETKKFNPNTNTFEDIYEGQLVKEGNEEKNKEELAKEITEALTRITNCVYSKAKKEKMPEGIEKLISDLAGEIENVCYRKNN